MAGGYGCRFYAERIIVIIVKATYLSSLLGHAENRMQQ